MHHEVVGIDAALDAEFVKVNGWSGKWARVALKVGMRLAQMKPESQLHPAREENKPMRTSAMTTTTTTICRWKTMRTKTYWAGKVWFVVRVSVCLGLRRAAGICTRRVHVEGGDRDQSIIR